MKNYNDRLDRINKINKLLSLDNDKLYPVIFVGAEYSEHLKDLEMVFRISCHDTNFKISITSMTMTVQVFTNTAQERRFCFDNRMNESFYYFCKEDLGLTLL